VRDVAAPRSRVVSTSAVPAQATAASMAGVGTRRYARMLDKLPEPRRDAVGFYERGIAALGSAACGSARQ
jgi:hypothetical protein